MSCGTSWVGFYPVMDRDLALSQNLLVDPFLQPNGPWGTMFAFTCIGVTIDRYIDEIILDGIQDVTDKYYEFNSLAEKAQLGAGGLVLDLEGDTDQALEKGQSLKGEHSREDISRAVMEGAAFLMRRRIEELAQAGIQASNITMVGGPAESPFWPQILADVTGLEFKIGFGQTAGAQGAAILAGIGSGVFSDLEQGFTTLKCEVKKVVPDSFDHKEYAKIGIQKL
ncbi:FGGY-family carbohydrate kinase [Planctomycetota bacterium]